MKPEQVAKYHAILLKMAERVEGLVHALEKEGLHPVGDEGAFSEGSPFPPELAAEAYEMEQTIEFIEEEEHLRDEIIAALRRIREGRFGICEGCGQPIPLRRLDAVPFARKCLHCAEQDEAGAL